MRNKEDLKSVHTSISMTQRLFDDIKREADERGIKPNAVMGERMEHPDKDNTPSKMVEFQTYANEVVRVMRMHGLAEAEYFERWANELWSF